MSQLKTQLPKYAVLTEVLNAITHGLGVVLGIIGLVFLLLRASTTLEYVSFSIYGASIILLFLASTIYHSFSFTKARKILRIIDHSSIFLLIAGTYIPFLLIGIGTSKAYIFAIIMGITALVGIIFKIAAFEKATKISTVIYLVMGWSVVLIMKDLLSHVNPRALYLLIGGGLAYSLGVIFYKNKKLLFSHVYWHLAVLLGAVLMYFSIYLYV